MRRAGELSARGEVAVVMVVGGGGEGEGGRKSWEQKAWEVEDAGALLKD